MCILGYSTAKQKLQGPFDLEFILTPTADRTKCCIYQFSLTGSNLWCVLFFISGSGLMIKQLSNAMGEKLSPTLSLVTMEVRQMPLPQMMVCEKPSLCFSLFKINSNRKTIFQTAYLVYLYVSTYWMQAAVAILISTWEFLCLLMVHRGMIRWQICILSTHLANCPMGRD